MTSSLNPLSLSVLNRIQRVVGLSSISNPIPLHEPDFRNTQSWDYVKDCLDSGWVSSAGSWVSRFENDFVLLPVHHMR